MLVYQRVNITNNFHQIAKNTPRRVAPLPLVPFNDKGFGKWVFVCWANFGGGLKKHQQTKKNEKLKKAGYTHKMMACHEKIL